MSMFKQVILQPRREAPLERHHPWILSGAVERVDGHPEAGETVEVLETLTERFGEKRLFWQWFSNSSYSTSSFLLFRTLGSFPAVSCR